VASSTYTVPAEETRDRRRSENYVHPVYVRNDRQKHEAVSYVGYPGGAQVLAGKQPYVEDATEAMESVQ
jgi:hypothetical protein